MIPITRITELEQEVESLKAEVTRLTAELKTHTTTETCADCGKSMEGVAPCLSFSHTEEKVGVREVRCWECFEARFDRNVDEVGDVDTEPMKEDDKS